ncbi:hypothetical protein BSZ39_00340 [Bowdeniella nasicola]|uniref:S1 motif domain-containing protein n=1 Tax=Bowdeniella nasicola TaxID=208480 RepID=A0A1Q5Q5V1_9ACTO|nr:hypothetical protein [Bowdeniella nasicola]OKL55186.1 hypothetical protein BSZ39_00340 [Bowdeniella nasicola]
MPKRKRSRERAARPPAAAKAATTPQIEPSAERPYAGEIQHVDDVRTARNLAAYVTDPARPVPLAVVTTDIRTGATIADADALLEASDGAADVVILHTGDASRAFEDQMPEGAHVFGGAGRVYPTGTDWHETPHKSRLRLSKGPREAEALTTLLRKDLAYQIKGAAIRRRNLEREERARELAARPNGPEPALAMAKASYCICSVREAERLATRLMHPERDFPVLVISIPTGQLAPSIDVDQLEDDLAGLCEIVLLPTDASSWRLTEMLPDGAGVYGGAARVYPPGTDWMQALHRAPLRFSYGPSDQAAATEVLFADAMRVARLRSSTNGRRHASGHVSGLFGNSRAIVELADGSYCSVWSDLIHTRTPVGSLLAPGQHVEGILDEASGRLDISEMLISPTLSYRPGDVVLALVRDVRSSRVTLSLLPDTEIAVPRELVTSNPRDSLTSLFSVDEIVAARLGIDEDGKMALRLDDVDDDEVPVPAPALTRGGPPWLTLAGDEDDEGSEEETGSAVDWDTLVSWEKAEEPEPAPAVPLPGPPTPETVSPGMQAQLDDLSQRLRDADRQNVAVRERAGKLRQRIDELEAETRTLRTELRSTKRQLSAKRVAGWLGDDVPTAEMFRFAVFRT